MKNVAADEQAKLEFRALNRRFIVRLLDFLCRGDVIDFLRQTPPVRAFSNFNGFSIRNALHPPDKKKQNQGK